MKSIFILSRKIVIRKIVITNVPDSNFMIMCISFRKSTFTIINNFRKEYAPFDICLYMYISVVMTYLRWVNCALYKYLILHISFFAAFKLFLSCKIAKHLYLKNCALLFCICAQVWLLWEHKLFCEVVL